VSENEEWRELLRRAKKSLTTIYELLKHNPHPDLAVEETCKEIVRLLEKPKNLSFSYYELTPAIIAEGRVKGVINAVHILANIGGEKEHFIVFFPVLLEAPERFLNKVLLHELIHVIGIKDEETTYSLTKKIALGNPRIKSYFTTDEEELRYIREWLGKTPRDKLIPQVNFFVYINTIFGLMKIYRRSVPVEVIGAPPPILPSTRILGICPVCGRPVLIGEEHTVYKGLVYHWKCFRASRP
jgi:hypothetical protein